MYMKEVTVVNRTGLHARPATQIVTASQKFSSNIWTEYAGRKVNFKSVFSILTACIKQGTTIQVYAEGDDEQEAGETICGMISSFTE